MKTDENALIRYVVERLTQRHPELPPDQIADIVHRTHERFADTKTSFPGRWYPQEGAIGPAPDGPAGRTVG